MNDPFEPGRRSDRWRWIWQDLKEARATQTLAGVFIALHLFVAIVVPDCWGDEAQNWVYLTFGLTRDALVEHYAAWQILTHGFLHANTWHLVVNLLALIMCGLQAERIAGSKKALSVFLTGVVAGGVAHVTLLPPGQANVPLVGASGGIAALFFWLVTLSPDLRSRFLILPWRWLGRIFLCVQAGLVIWQWIAPPAAGAIQVGHACHLGGSLAGWLMARHLMRRTTLTLAKLKKQRSERESYGAR